MLVSHVYKTPPDFQVWLSLISCTERPGGTFLPRAQANLISHGKRGSWQKGRGYLQRERSVLIVTPRPKMQILLHHRSIILVWNAWATIWRKKSSAWKNCWLNWCQTSGEYSWLVNCYFVSKSWSKINHPDSQKDLAPSWSAVAATERFNRSEQQLLALLTRKKSPFSQNPWYRYLCLVERNAPHEIWDVYSSFIVIYFIMRQSLFRPDWWCELFWPIRVAFSDQSARLYFCSWSRVTIGC